MTVTDNSLRSRQVAAIERMLNFNKPSNATTKENDVIIWKILILDRKTTSIVSSILSVNDLLESGVTMHTVINSPKRTALPDVPGIYFVEPTKANILKIVEDIEKDYYEEYYINFLSNLSRELLEELANLVSLTGKSTKVKQVFDQYLDYLVTEPQLFSLEISNVYSKLHSTKATEDEISRIAEDVATGLFNIIITLNNIPIIRAPRGGAAEFVAQKLDSLLRDHVLNMKSNSVSFNNNSADPRQVLILLDRNIDLPAMFSHSWIYSCMISDVFKLDRNIITLETSEKITKKHYLDNEDFFWKKNSFLPFPDVVENIEEESNDYRRKAAELTSKTGVTSLSDIDPNQSDTYQIQQAIKQLPQLTSKKVIIDDHMMILDELLKKLQKHNLDLFFEIEQNCLNNNNNDIKKIQDDYIEKFLNNDNGDIVDNKNDKLRTYLILFLKLDLDDGFKNKVESHLKDLNCDLSPLNYIKKVKEIVKLSGLAESTNNPDNTTSYSSNSTSLLSGFSTKLFEGSKIAGGVGSIMSSIKNLMPEKQYIMPITKIVESIMEPTKANQVTLNTTDDYLYYDPTNSRGNHSRIPKRSTYSNSIVFLVGGGNYLEYENLQQWIEGINTLENSNNGAATGAANSLLTKRNVIYGSTSVLSPKAFLEECGILGNDGINTESDDLL